MFGQLAQSDVEIDSYRIRFLRTNGSGEEETIRDTSKLLGTEFTPDFELPDLSGTLHRLSDHRGRKVLLIAYASW